ncbi:uncharacterized protein L3040_008730 [Drepanopeziza brunnea f. sp. 'multigermtubi']|uniref:uncharacterized protein n=1 Tax=Drepanopeziza brunnea f. sp. 'multigermtubi' TaxID=698441 RepID=UPI002386F341|nr:hypothetical protein L3040_008730 [Drepanopeziza brunnea f. sp. 'multigermtubi']
MAWGSSNPKTPPPPESALSKLLPLLILIVVVGGFAFVGYYVYVTVCGISTAAGDKMEKKNVVFTKDGMKVGVKELQNEKYVDKTQSAMVKMWNAASFPAYKSRIWNQNAEINKPTSRNPFSRNGSSSSAS